MEDDDGFRDLQSDGVARSGQADGAGVWRSRRADEAGRRARLHDRLVRRAPFLELLPVCVAIDDGGALRLGHQKDPARHRGRGIALVQPGSACRRNRHCRRIVEWPTDARHRRRLSAYEFERFGVDIAQNLEMTDEFCDILDLAFSRDFFSYDGKHYQIPETHIPARTVQNPLPIYVAGHTQAMFRAAARHGYRVLTSGRVGGAKLLAGQYADIVAAFAAENAPLSRAHITVNRFAHITDSRE